MTPHEVLQQHAKVVRRVLATPDGQALIRVLDQYYEKKLFHVDPNVTAYNLGGYDLLKLLKRLGNELDGDTTGGVEGRPVPR